MKSNALDSLSEGISGAASNLIPGEGDTEVSIDIRENYKPDYSLLFVRELMEKHPECLLYGQDVGGRLGGVFREAATLAQQFGDERVFNTPIQEAFIIGSTVGFNLIFIY